METKNLIIRRFRPGDLADFMALIRDKMASKYAAFDDQYPTDGEGLAGALNYFVGSDQFFALQSRGENRVVGFVSLNRVDDGVRNLGFCLRSDRQGRGWGGEAVAEIKDYAKSVLKLEELVSGTAEENEPSVRLLTASGFTPVSRERVSFTRDADGKPVEFTACTFRCGL